MASEETGSRVTSSQETSSQGNSSRETGSPEQEVTYYLISDLHIGGDAGLNQVEYEREFIEFLQKIKAGPLPAELIILGDTFGLWELTTVPPADRMSWIIRTHPELFEQFRSTGETVRITAIPGNHDHDLFCTSRYRDTLAKYNIRVEAESHIKRPAGRKSIWIEHGDTHDPFNAYNHSGNCDSVPPGFHLTRGVASSAARSAHLGKSPWLRDLESVYPNEELPRWLISNYFYREMGTLLRWIFVPLMSLFWVSVIVLIGALLEYTGVLETSFFTTPLSTYIGLPGRLLDWMIWIDAVAVVVLLILSVPGFFIIRDIRKALRRFGLAPPRKLTADKDNRYTAAARKVFARHPDVVVFAYGHTHQPSLKRTDGRVILNTGTWLKRLERVRPWIRPFPPVYVPSFQLNYFVVSSKNDRITVTYHDVPKRPQKELTALQRFLILGKKARKRQEPVPRVTVLENPAPDKSIIFTQADAER
jgi:UDP-2,3-diacylglucosamine pyrophosphatase LpxH